MEEHGGKKLQTRRRPSFPLTQAAKYLRSVIASWTLESEETILRGCVSEDYDKLLERVTKQKRTLKLKLLNGDLILTEFPLNPHAMLIAQLTLQIGLINLFDFDDPLQSYGSTRYCAIDHINGIAPDSSFINRRVPDNIALRDANGVRVPVFVIEIALIEDWATIIRSVEAYFTLRVLQVIYIKLFKTEDLDQPTHVRITQMYVMDFRRPMNYVAGMQIQAWKVISFGHQPPHNATAEAILRHTRVNPADFIGYGRHNMNQRCQQAGHEVYRVIFPAQIIWHSVPENEIPAGAFVDYHLDLFCIIDALTPDYLSA